MKTLFKLLCIVVTLLAAVITKAQVAKGHVQAGSLLTINFQNDDLIDNKTYTDSTTNLKEFTFSVMPVAGIGIGKNFILGGGIGYSYSRNVTQNIYDGGYFDTAKVNTRSITYKLFVRKFIPFNEKAGAYAELGGEYSSSRQTTLNAGYTGKAKYYSTTVYMVPGIYYKINKNFCLDMQFGGLIYNLQKNKPGFRKEVQTVEFTLPHAIGVGFLVTL